METLLKTNTGEQLNFIDLFRSKKYNIEIPIIQRDYAQGRLSKEKIRRGFLDSLFDSLTNDKKTDLDFVYGYVTGTENKFIPLDGQQRITTLFLLHFYLSHKDSQEEHFRNILLFEEKSRFTYETRTSSRDFCNSLMQNGIELTETTENEGNSIFSISKNIQNSHWYYLSWNNDPTIKGMLVMLDSIHDKFKATKGFYQKLISETNPIITFQFLNLQDRKMTDDLYIKMNARGKPLTDFENFKAQFEKYLEKTHSTLTTEFSMKIDGAWTDLFWNYSIDHPETKAKKIDKHFINYFDFISEMLFYKDNAEDIESYTFNDFKIIESIYKSEENISFLIKALDLFSIRNSKTLIDSFFQTLFSQAYDKDKICLFGEKPNLFESLIFSLSFGHIEKLLLFALINYFISSDSKELVITDNLKNYMRVCRNFVLKINQKGNSNNKDMFVTELRTSSYGEIINTLLRIYDKEDVYASLSMKADLFTFRKDNIQGEIFKAKIISENPKSAEYINKLEDHLYLKCDLRNFELLIPDEASLMNLTSLFYEIFGVIDDGLIIRSLLSIDDYSVGIGNSLFGGLYFFGKGEKWHRVLTDKDDSNKFQNILKDYFDKLNHYGAVDIATKLNNLVNESLEKSELPTWILMFLKYPILTQTTHSIFAFEDDLSDYKIERIDGPSLRHWHINVYADAVLNSPALNVKVNKNQKSKDANETGIFLENQMFLIPEENFWFVNPQNIDISHLHNDYTLQQIENKNLFRLFPTKDKDFVQVAVDFVNEICLLS